MTGRLPRITATECERALKRDGWSVARHVGSHRAFQHPTKTGMVILPIHPGDLPLGTIRGIITSMGLTVDEFRRLL